MRAAFDPRGHVLAVSSGTAAWLWRVPENVLVGRITGVGASIAYSPDGKLLVSGGVGPGGGDGQRLTVTDVASRKQVTPPASESHCPSRVRGCGRRWAAVTSARASPGTPAGAAVAFARSRKKPDSTTSVAETDGGNVAPAAATSDGQTMASADADVNGQVRTS